VTGEMSSERYCLSVLPSTTAAEVIRLVLDARNVHDEQHLYSLIAVPTGDSRLSTGVHCAVAMEYFSTDIAMTQFLFYRPLF